MSGGQSMSRDQMMQGGGEMPGPPSGGQMPRSSQGSKPN